MSNKELLFIISTVIIGSILIISEVHMLSKQMTEELREFNNNLDARIETLQEQTDYNLQRYYE